MKTKMFRHTFLFTLMICISLNAVTNVSAQTPETSIEIQALAIEDQLRCPVCVNEGLTTCALALCNDIKNSIRTQLANGRSPDNILLFFEESYGTQIRSSLAPRGFNLWLWSWTAGSIMIPMTGIFLLIKRLRSETN